MRVTKTIELPGTLEVARAILHDPDFREQVAREAGASEVSVDVSTAADGTAVATVDTAQPTTGMPSLATKFLGRELRIHQEERWASATDGTLVVEIPGQPGRVDGTVTLAESGGVTTQTVDAQIKVSIPLLGGKIEKLIGSVLGHVLKIQAAQAATWQER